MEKLFLDSNRKKRKNIFFCDSAILLYLHSTYYYMNMLQVIVFFLHQEMISCRECHVMLLEQGRHTGSYWVCITVVRRHYMQE